MCTTVTLYLFKFLLNGSVILSLWEVHYVNVLFSAL